MFTSLIMVDDFLNEPEKVREAALRLDYPQPAGRTNFPGRNSRQRLSISGLDTAVSQVVGEPVVGQVGQAHEKCRLTLASDEGKQAAGVHIDPAVQWSGILYLSRPADCRGGTEFYRHKPTGTDRAPMFEHEFPRYGISEFDELDGLLKRDSLDPSKWEHLMTAPMRFNRLVLLRPWLWHTAGPAFGDRPENGRLVLLYFFVRRATA